MLIMTPCGSIRLIQMPGLLVALLKMGKDGIYYKLTEPLSVPAGDHTLRVRYKGVRDGQSYIHDTDTKEFSLAAPSTLTLNGDASLTKTFEEIQVSGDSLVFSGNVPMGSTSDMDEEATRESHP